MYQIWAILVLSVALMGASLAHADTLTFSYETENLNGTNTWEQTIILDDGWTEQSIFAEWVYLYPPGNATNPDPVKADPVGKFFELLINDGANIFKPIIEPIADVVEEIVEVIANVTEAEPEPEYTAEEQEILDSVYTHCEELSEKLKAIGLAFDFEFKSDEFYFKHPIQAIKDGQDCRARGTLGNDVLGSMYLTLAEEAKVDAEDFLDIKETQGPSHVAPDMEELLKAEAKTAQGKIENSTYLGVPEKIPDPVIGTNVTKVDEATKEYKDHQVRENNNIENLKKLCSLLWESTGNGTTTMRTWANQLYDGTCTGFLFLKVWDYEEQVRIEKEIDLPALIEQKVAAGDERQ